MLHKPIDPYDDPRVTHNFTVLNGRRYHYVEALPQGVPRATILCVHGFPDLWYGWRFIIPHLQALGLRVIVPDLVGYGQTEMPRVPPADMNVYSWKTTADDMAALVKHINVPNVILLGHDWGGAIVSRIYIYHPEVVSHIASVCTPYFGLARRYIPIEEFVKRVPTFTYQIAFNNPQTEKDLESRDAISRFFRGVYRGFEDSRVNIQVCENFMEAVGDHPRGKLLTEKELNYYVDEYARNGFHGPLNWYKTRYQNYLNEKDLPDITINVPYLYIGATYDVALPPSMGAHQAAEIPLLTSKIVKATHWVLIEAPEVVCNVLEEWIEKVVFGVHAKL